MNQKITMSNIFNKQISSFGDQISKLYHYDYDRPETLTLTFQVTENCNLNCSYCYQHHKTNNKLDFNTAKEAIDLILKSSDKVKNYINLNDKIGVILEFIGGEPLLEVELIDKICSYFISQIVELNHPWLLRFRISITTNGILYFTEKVQSFIKKYKNYLSLGITLDGNKELHDMCRKDFNNNPTYDKVEKAVKHYKEHYNSDLSTKLTLSPDNVKFLYEGIINFINLGFKNIHFNPIFEEGWKTHHARIYYQQLKKIINYLIKNNLDKEINLTVFNFSIGQKSNNDKNWCGGTGSMLSVDHQGNFYPCIRYMESSLNNKQKPYIIGNIKDGIGNNKELKDKIDILKNITKSSQSSRKCLKCPIESGCAWCSGYNYEIYGTPNKRATFICKMHQARVLAFKYYIKKLCKKYNYIDDFKLNIPISWALQIINLKEYLQLRR